MSISSDFSGFCMPIREVNGSEALGRIASSPKVVVKFYSPDCGHCSEAAPKVQAASCPYNTDVDFMAVNVDEHPEVAEKYGIESIPHVVAFKGGAKVEENVGDGSTEQFAAMFAKLVSGE